MNIDQLYYFYEAANCGSFSSAASKIFTSPQNVSKAISKLENELDSALFLRNPHGVQLTSKGLIFYEKVSHILDEFNQLKKDFIKNDLNENDLHLNICSTPNINSYFMTKMLKKLFADTPSIMLNLKEESMHSILPFCLKNNYLGVAFFLNDYFSNTLLKQFANDISFECIYQSRLGICVNKNSPLANKKVLTLREALNQTFVCNSWFSWANSGFPNMDQSTFFNTSNQELLDLLVIQNKAISFALKDFLILRNHHHSSASHMVFIPLKEEILVSAIIFKSIYHPMTTTENTFISTARDIIKNLQHNQV